MIQNVNYAGCRRLKFFIQNGCPKAVNKSIHILALAPACFLLFSHILYTCCPHDIVDIRNACSVNRPMLRWVRKNGNKWKGVWDMELLSDDLLVDSYYMAVQLHLEAEFIRLLLNEMERRGINPDSYRIGA